MRLALPPGITSIQLKALPARAPVDPKWGGMGKEYHTSSVRRGFARRLGLLLAERLMSRPDFAGVEVSVHEYDSMVVTTASGEPPTENELNAIKRVIALELSKIDTATRLGLLAEQEQYERDLGLWMDHRNGGWALTRSDVDRIVGAGFAPEAEFEEREPEWWCHRSVTEMRHRPRLG